MSRSVSVGETNPFGEFPHLKTTRRYSFIRHNMPCVFHILTSLKVVSAKKNIFRWICTSKNMHTPMKLPHGRTWNQLSKIFGEFSTYYYWLPLDLKHILQNVVLWGALFMLEFGTKITFILTSAVKTSKRSAMDPFTKNGCSEIVNPNETHKFIHRTCLNVGANKNQKHK